MHYRFRLLLLVIVFLLIGAPTPAPARAQTALAFVHPSGASLARPDGSAFFVFGYNYEGPFDRAWQMWQRFDRGLIADDLGRARGGGANTVRIFIQQPLPGEIMAGDFSKLDTVIDLAARNGLFVLLTFFDYAERDLAKVAEVNRRIAERYRDNPTILAYDLRNEPQYLTLASALYPADLSVPLQRADLVPIYGERIGRAELPAYRLGADGRVLPAGWSDDQVYAYANNLAYFRQLISDAERWASAASGRTVIDYLASPDSARWRPLIDTLDGTLRSWIDTQRRAIRSVDQRRMLTIGWSNLIFAGLPANGAMLDFVSLHRFPRPGIGSVSQTLDLGASLRRLFPSRPLLFEEVGFSTADADPETAGILEMAITLRAYSEGYAGFLKWMLTDLPPVGDPRQDNYGALRIDARPKPVYYAFGAFGAYLANSAAPPHGSLVAGESAGGPTYTFSGRDIFYAGGQETAGSVRVRLDAPGQLMLRKRGALYMMATQPGNVMINLRELMPGWLGGATVERRAGDGWAPVGAQLSGDDLRFDIAPATAYRVSLPSAYDRAAVRGDCRYFAETMHNLCGAFRAYWEANGGLAIFGYPISEEYRERNATDGQVYTVQYFERNRFEYHPEFAGTRYEVLLGLLGSDLTAARRGEGPFQPIAVAPPGRDLFRETGHSLGGAFRAYWQANGGLAVFGYPISEEFAEYNPADGKIYTVQYFERNRFEYHPEFAGTRYEVLLGLLGNQTVDGNGWR
jgi:hypothetical protein